MTAVAAFELLYKSKRATATSVDRISGPFEDATTLRMIPHSSGDRLMDRSMSLRSVAMSMVPTHPSGLARHSMALIPHPFHSPQS